MDPRLTRLLEYHDLADFSDALLKFGIKRISDRAYADERDLVEKVGMTLIDARKLLACSPDVPDKIALTEDAESDGASKASTMSPVALVREKSKCRRAQSTFWRGQFKRPMRVIFIRHGESEANVDRKITASVPDHMLHLTAKGRDQALDAGKRLMEIIATQNSQETVRFTVSPYVRTRETLNGILWSMKEAGVSVDALKIKEDLRIREQEYGNFDAPTIKVHHQLKRDFGPFYYRFPEGESPADCFVRASEYIESMYRSWEDNEQENHVIVCHGLMILVILMRLLNTPVGDFDSFDSLKNCEFIVLERPEDDPKYQVSYTWAAGEAPKPGGLRKKQDPPQRAPIWDGDPNAPILTNENRWKELEESGGESCTNMASFRRPT